MSDDNVTRREFLNEVEAVFADAVQLDGPDRAAFLERRLEGRDDVRIEVESLLSAHVRAAGFLRDPTRTDADDDRRAMLREGDIVGAFRLVERIASGGMGTVYRAERVDAGFTQQVAVKLIAAPMSHETMARRFRAERQILASLQHAHIVTLIDGGVTARGDAYLVMEYVDGVPISTYCRDRALDLAARLRLFGQVCDAVQYAHAHFVVHRDLKPANVLVTRDGVPKVLDFGVARLVDDRPEPGANQTEPGVGPLTPNYASPEQLSGRPITTATDVYALGVLLFELLTGTRPYETSGKPLDEVMRLVVDTDPIRPSEAQPSAEMRPPYEWRRLLRGDLDAIALRALRKDPAERFSSADAFSKDIARYLKREPVDAREPSFSYVLRKLAGRHRVAFASAGIAAVLVIAASAVAIRQARVATRERAVAARRFNDVRRLAHALIFDVHDSVEPLNGSTPVRKTIVSEGLMYLERLAPESSDDPALQIELGRAYIKIGSVQGRPNTPNLGDRAGAITSFRKARALLAPAATAANAAAPVFASYLDATRFLSETLGFVGIEREEALAVARDGARAAARFAEQHPRAGERLGFTALSEFQLAVAVGMQDSLPHWEKAGAAFDALLREQPDDPARQRNAALVEKYLGAYYDKVDRLAGLVHHQRALDLDQKRLDRAPDTRTTQLDVAIDLANVALAHWRRNELPEAIADYERSLAMRRRLLATDPTDALSRAKVAFVEQQLGILLSAQGVRAAAMKYLRGALDDYKAAGLTSAQERASAASTLIAIGGIEATEGRRAGACATFKQAIDLFHDISEEDRRVYAQAETIAYANERLAACGAAPRVDTHDR